MATRRRKSTRRSRARPRAPVDLHHLVNEGSETRLRGRLWELPRTPPRPPLPLFVHQAEALEAVLERNRGHSGVIHLPTGAGKTVVALALMQALLRRDPRTVFVWATHGKTVLRQGFGRLLEAAPSFPARLVATWLEGVPAAGSRVLERANVVFVTRHTLTGWLKYEVSTRSRHGPLNLALTSAEGRPVVLIYDECHELGAEKLMAAFRRFHKKLLEPSALARARFRVFGLSATPLPSSGAARRTLAETLFPIVPGTVSARREWGMLVHSSQPMSRLVARNILCPVNLHMHRRGGFEIPAELIDGFDWESGPELPDGLDWPDWLREEIAARGPDKREAHEFAMEFNREVMTDPRVLAHLADRIGAQLPSLGKTIVYCASIRAATRLVALLKNHPRVGPGRVTLVHSRMEDPELVDPGDASEEADSAWRSAQAQIARFRSLGSQPCVMVNVGMLTTGFDDPKIRTVVLARLTFSTNLFWQMIGRGLRGVAVGGTPDCFVIDPVRLTERFELYAGYKPDLTRGGLSDETDQVIRGRLTAEDLAPPVVDRVPLDGPDDDLPGLRVDVAEALRAFLRAETPLSPDESGALFDHVSVAPRPGGGLAWTERAEDAPLEARAHTLRAALEARLDARSKFIGADLMWVLDVLPGLLDAPGVQVALTIVQRVEQHDLRTREAWHRYLAERL